MKVPTDADSLPLEMLVEAAIQTIQAHSQDFLWGGGGRGGAYLKNWDQIMNVLNDTLC